MARAYTHMPLHERVLSFIDQRCRELEEQLRDAESELTMWVEHRKDPTVFSPEKLEVSEERELFHWLNRRQQVLTREVTDLRREIAMWKTHRKNLNLCPTCNGYGKLRVHIAQDEGYLEKCSGCGGTGRPSPAVSR